MTFNEPRARIRATAALVLLLAACPVTFAEMIVAGPATGSGEIVDAGQVYSTINETDCLKWPSEDMKRLAGERGWGAFRPVNGMTGEIVWKARHCDSHIEIYIMKTGGYHVPIGAAGVRVTGESASPVQSPAPAPAPKAAPAPADTAGPEIVVTEPEVARGMKARAQGKDLLVKGRASDPSGVYEVKVNGVEARLSSDGSFWAQVRLAPGENTIRVAASDTRGNEREQTFTVLREADAAPAPRPAPASAAPPSVGGYHALVIGNDAYAHLPRLSTARKDAEAVAAVLRQDYGFQAEVLLDAGRAQVLDAINRYRKTLKPEDSFLIYYAGHGEFDKTAEKAYWLPVDARRDDDTEWIIVDSLTSNIKRISSAHVMVVADSCYSGTLTRAALTDLGSGETRSRYLQKMLKKPSRTLLSSGGNEPVSDSGAAGHSIFAQSFIEGLKSMDRPSFTAEELFHEHIREAVAGRAEQTPEYSTIRNSGHNGGDFVFIRTRRP